MSDTSKMNCCPNMQERVVSRVARTQVCTDLNQHVELHDEAFVKLTCFLGGGFPPSCKKLCCIKEWF